MTKENINDEGKNTSHQSNVNTKSIVKKHQTGNVWTEYVDTKLTREENEGRMKEKDGSCYRIKTDDKKLKKLVLEQEKLINLLSDYYLRTTVYGVTDLNEIREKQCINLEETMFPLYEKSSCDSDYDNCDTPFSPIRHFLSYYSFMTDMYNEFDDEEVWDHNIDLGLIIESDNQIPVKVMRSIENPNSISYKRDDDYEIEPSTYYGDWYYEDENVKNYRTRKSLKRETERLEKEF